MGKTDLGNFFEDFRVGQVFRHATPRTLGEGDRALYRALYPSRFALWSSAAFAAACGLEDAPLEELIGFHVAFGKTVPDISRNAMANLGYAQCRFLRPFHVGDTLSAQSEVIGLKENSSGKSGVVWVRSEARTADGALALEWVRWVMVRKRDAAAPAPKAVIPDLAPAVAAADLSPPPGLDFTRYDFAAAGEPHRWGDYEVGEIIDHGDGVTLEDAEHMMATRLWQNTARVHFDAASMEGRPRLIYGGHIISLARALSFNGLANAQMIAAINGGTHAGPASAGDTVYAWSEVLAKAETAAPGVGALRLRLAATRGRGAPGALKDADGKYAPHILLDLDYWALIPT